MLEAITAVYCPTVIDSPRNLVVIAISDGTPVDRFSDTESDGCLNGALSILTETADE